MKFYSTTIFTFFYLFIFNYLNAQITIESSDMPSKGDTVRLSMGLNVNFIDYTQTGEDFLWDFSALQPVKQTLDTFISPLDTPYWLAFITSSNLAKNISNILDIPELPVSNVYEFYKKKSALYKSVGYGVTINEMPIPLVYSNPDIIYKFPMQYGNVDSSSSGLDFGMNNVGYILVDRNRKNTVDGFGTLITPYGTYEVLRLKSEVNEYDSVYIDSLNTGYPLNRTYIEYKWLAKNIKEPLLQITTSDLGVISAYVDSLRDITVGNKEITYNSLNIFPNPTCGDFNISFSQPPKSIVSVDIYSLSGNLIWSEKKLIMSRETKIKLNDKLSNGNYIIVINWDKHLITRKVIINNTL